MSEIDPRQMNIRERAGLDESRVNEEFKEFLQRWGLPILLIVAAISLFTAGRNYFKQEADKKVNAAFTQMQDALSSGNPSPESLRRIADDFKDVRSVAEMCRLNAADLYHLAAVRGVKSGAQPQPDGGFAAGDLMNDEERKEHLAMARELYQQVYDTTGSNPDKTILALNALFGLASVEEATNNRDAAKRWYEQVIAKAESAKMDTFAVIARSRIESLPKLEGAPRLWARSELPELPKPEPKIDGAKLDLSSPAPSLLGPNAPTPNLPTTNAPGPAAPTPDNPTPAPANPVPAPTPANPPTVPPTEPAAPK